MSAQTRYVSKMTEVYDFLGQQFGYASADRFALMEFVVWFDLSNDFELQMMQ
jgi:hypothetical protein